MRSFFGTLAVLAAVAFVFACSAPTTATNSTNFVYNNWSCGNQSQCIAVMGHNVGSAGPFCTRPPCLAWGQRYIPGAYSCNATAAYPIYNAPPAGTCQT
jgi:hypothetical protein